MRRLAIFALLACACRPGYLLVELDSTAGISGITQVQVSASIPGETRSETVFNDATPLALPPAATFGISFDPDALPAVVDLTVSTTKETSYAEISAAITGRTSFNGTSPPPCCQSSRAEAWSGNFWKISANRWRTKRFAT